MGNYAEHISQAKRNLHLIEHLNDLPNYWDWKVTVCFYAAVHLVNAHIARKANLHYRSHVEVDNAINPHRTTSICTISADAYKAYEKLKNLSRRSRYMISDSMDNQTTEALPTVDKHFARAVRYLNTILKYISDEYTEAFPSTAINCIEFKGNENLAYFRKQ